MLTRPKQSWLVHSDSCLSYILFGLLWHTLHGAILKEYLEIAADSECSHMGSLWLSYSALLLCELHWLQLGFWVWSKMLVITYKALQGKKKYVTFLLFIFFLFNPPSLVERTYFGSLLLNIIMLNSRIVPSQLQDLPYETASPWRFICPNCVSLL